MFLKELYAFAAGGDVTGASTPNWSIANKKLLKVSEYMLV